MSSAAVRVAARALASSGGWPTVHVETVGESPDPETLPDDWSSLSFQGFTDDPIGIGPASIIRETGRIEFLFASRSGRGDAALVALVEAAVAEIRAYAWGAAGIFPTSISAPIPDDEGGAGNFLLMRVELDYERDHT